MNWSAFFESCHMMASSRYHGIVTSMPGLVPSAGITMDERIRNLMRERGHPELLMTVDDPDLEPKLLAALEILATQGERIADGIARTVVKNLRVMARMGVFFEEEVQRRYPEFPTRHRRMELGGLSSAHERFFTSAVSPTISWFRSSSELMPFVGDIFVAIETGSTRRSCRKSATAKLTGVTGAELLELDQQSAYVSGIETSPKG